MGARSTGSHPTTTKADGHLLEYFRQNFDVGGGANSGPTVPPPVNIEATGGTISEYTDGPAYYRAHTFTASSDSFTVQSDSLTTPFSDTVDVILIGGGGGGGYGGGGGGAGGYVQLTGMPLGAIPGPNVYTVAIGAGGGGGTSVAVASPGSDATISNPSNSNWLVAKGGGRGAGSPEPSSVNPGTNMAGGSGGGGGHYNGTPQTNQGPATQPTQTFPLVSPPFISRNDGSAGNYAPGSPYTGGAGGGAAGSGPGTGASTNDGGNGRANTLQYGPSYPQTYAAGGGGGCFPTSNQTSFGGSSGLGGGNRNVNIAGNRAYTYASGSGGGGGGGGGSYHNGGSGSGGICIIRYRIAAASFGGTKATGGTISYYGGKTIHTFRSTGTFTANESLSCDVVVLGGGGAGGANEAGGGGAGGYVFVPGKTIPADTYTVTIGGGGTGVESPGVDTTFGSTPQPAYLIAYGGGGGGSWTGGNGSPGGSGGGGGAFNSSPGGVGGSATQPGAPGDSGTYGIGYPGGDGGPGSPYKAAGGGGAGSQGQDYDGPGGAGGIGVQLPSTFQDPNSTIGYPGPGDTRFYVAGGGGGADNSPVSNYGGAGGSWNQPTLSLVPGANAANWYAGAGVGGITLPSGEYNTRGALANSGSGGGGHKNPISANPVVYGGSGIVLIAYPS